MFQTEVSTGRLVDLPGSTATTASLRFGGITPGAISPGGDTDWYRVELQPGSYYASITGDSGTLADTQPLGRLEHQGLELRDANGVPVTTIPYADGSAAGAFTIATAGTYYVAVSGQGAGDTGNYALQLFSNDGDDHNSGVSGTQLSLSQTATGVLERWSDGDGFLLGARTGRSFLTAWGTVPDLSLLVTDSNAVDLTRVTGTGSGVTAVIPPADFLSYGIVYSDGGRGTGSFTVRWEPTRTPDLPVAAGTSADDSYAGAAQAVEYWGLEGNDTIAGSPGGDALVAGAGQDQVTAGEGADSLWGGDGDDALDGGGGADLVDGDAGADTVHGAAGNDTVRGLDGNDLLYGDEGDDDLNGNLGADTVYGGEGNDQLRGGRDADTVYGEAGDDPMVNGNRGEDVVYGGAGNDGVHGGQDNDVLYGGAGADTLEGDLGDDRLFGEGDADLFVIRSGGGHDTVQDFQAGVDRIAVPVGTTWTVGADAGGNAVLDLGGGTTLTLAGIASTAFQAGWVVTE
jgi:Ca2+-binding RTX toxin-like protein